MGYFVYVVYFGTYFWYILVNLGTVFVHFGIFMDILGQFGLDREGWVRIGWDRIG